MLAQLKSTQLLLDRRCPTRRAHTHRLIHRCVCVYTYINNKQAHVIHVTVDVPHGITVCPRPPTTPLALETGGCGSDNPQHMEHTQGTTGAGWGRITHNTGNHRAPSPSPPLRHTDDNDGDDVVHNDVDVLFPVWLLVVPFLLCCSGLRQRMFIALFS